MEDNKPTGSDVEVESKEREIEDLLNDDIDTGNKDVADKGELNKLSLDELNNISKRKFETKEDFFKHYEGLKNLVGDQELAKERKEKVKEDKKAEVKDDATAKELAELKKDLAKKDFLIEKPTAKEYMDVLEAYAEKNNLSLSEAWEAKFKFAETSQGVQKTDIISKNRIAPVHSQRISELAKTARTGDETSQNELIKEVLGESMAGLK